MNINLKNNIEDIVNNRLERLFSVIEEVCPRNALTSGLVSHDEYHGDMSLDISMLTTCQLLWAITTAKTFAQSHYIIVGLLEEIKKQLSNKYFETRDRAFEKSFLLLALTYAPMQFSDPLYKTVVEMILNSQNSDGSWPTCSGEPSDYRATALNIIALSECYSYVGQTEESPFSKIKNAVMTACRWLETKVSDEGYWNRSILSKDSRQSVQSPGVELTAWCVYALMRAIENDCYQFNASNKRTDNIKKAVSWLISQDFEKVATTAEIEAEIYIKDLTKSNEKKKHGYGAGSLEILIVALVEYRKSRLYKFISGYDRLLEKAVERLTQNMNDDGDWYDKNSDSYSRVWPLAYALKALSAYHQLLDSKNAFKEQALQNIRILIKSLPTIIWKFKFVIICIGLTIFAITHENNITKYIEFLNSKVCTAIGLICTVLSFIQGIRK